MFVEKKTIVKVTLLLLLLIIGTSKPQIHIPLHDSNPKTPEVNKIEFQFKYGFDSHYQPLVNGELDMIPDPVGSAYSYFAGRNNVTLINTERNGYGLFIINCEKYPLNITAFRRAIAYALDKENISSDVLDGTGHPLDAPVPRQNPMSIEDNLEGLYYEAHPELGNDLLDDAGFTISNETGYRLTPNGSEFQITIEGSSTNLGLGSAYYLGKALESLNINYEDLTFTYNNPERLYFHGDYDIWFTGVDFFSDSLTWLENYHSENAEVDFSNLPNFRNSTYDSHISNLLTSYSFEETFDAAKALQEILVYECPVVITYQNVHSFPVRTDTFSGFVDPLLSDRLLWWNYMLAEPEFENNPGEALRVGVTQPEIFNPYREQYTFPDASYLKLLFPSLLQEGPAREEIGWLAKSYSVETHPENPDIIDGHQRFTFEIVSNATWSDSEPLTAEDVLFSFLLLYNQSENVYGSQLQNLFAAYTPTPFRFVIEFDTESYWYYETVAHMPIVPKHIWSEIDNNDEFVTWLSGFDLEGFVTCGPFRLDSYSFQKSLILRYDEDFFYSRYTETNTNNTDEGTDYMPYILGGFLLVIIPSIMIVSVTRRKKKRYVL